MEAGPVTLARVLATADQWRTKRALVPEVMDESAARRVRLVADGGGLENR
jgi:hypothetical protein